MAGDQLVNGRPLAADFQRGTAYVEQQDVHEFTATIREAFRFSAYLRQPATVSKEEKDAYVEDVIQLLELEDQADAMIGFPGFGLSVEARKRVTIGVELSAKPQLLLFLDEPTSGLDGQSAYNLIRFLKKLAAAGQAILCTIHQPNALLFENFDRLLLLKSGGRTVYFGDIGKDSHVIRDYFARNGAECPPSANPAEFMLDVSFLASLSFAVYWQCSHCDVHHIRRLSALAQRDALVTRIGLTAGWSLRTSLKSSERLQRSINKHWPRRISSTPTLQSNMQHLL